MLFKRVVFSDGQEAIVVAFDICSSSDVIEELTGRADINRYRRLIGQIKKHLAKAQKRILFDPYKFTGDGWILLFPAEGLNGKHFLRFMKDLSTFFKREFKKLVKFLDTPPETTGITFGVDKGPIFRTTIFQAHEYIGRPINVACRLQGAIKDKDVDPAYRVLVTNAVYNGHLKPATGYSAVETTRSLRNIRGGKKFQCVQIGLLKEGRR